MMIVYSSIVGHNAKQILLVGLYRLCTMVILQTINPASIKVAITKGIIMVIAQIVVFSLQTVYYYEYNADT